MPCYTLLAWIKGEHAIGIGFVKLPVLGWFSHPIWHDSKTAYWDLTMKSKRGDGIILFILTELACLWLNFIEGFRPFELDLFP